MSAIDRWRASPNNSSQRIPSLDGCRAVSICLVLIAHLCNTPLFHSFDPYARIIYHCGPFGVKVFFVISGYLITTLLVHEEAKHGRISLKNFYIRRAFRIWPVAYAFILVVAVLSSVGIITLPASNLIYASTFTMNHVLIGSWWTGHLWSLAIEEQFYLVWPIIFLVSARRQRLFFCICIILLAPVLRIVTHEHASALYEHMQESLLFLGDSLAAGCAMALASEKIESNIVWGRILRSRLFVVVPLLSVGMYATLAGYPGFYLAFGETVALICISATIWRVIHIRDASYWLLNSKPFVAVGVLSYSLYVWQQLFLSPTANTIVNRLPFNLICVFGVGVLSYYFVESPFLYLRSRLSTSVRKGRKETYGEKVRAVPDIAGQARELAYISREE